VSITGITTLERAAIEDLSMAAAERSMPDTTLTTTRMPDTTADGHTHAGYHG
jgi:hypothetical protein